MRIPSAVAISTYSLRAEPDEAAEADELRLHLALELVELGDRPGLDELAEASGDPWPDPAELLHAAGADELVDRRLRLADRLGCPAVGARGVGAGARKVEQRRKRLQALGDRSVLHVPYIPITWYPAST